MHVSLTKELENRIKERVETGMYHSASEVVREALRKYFHEDDTFTDSEISYIRQKVASRLEDLENGTKTPEDFDKAFHEITDKVFS